ncbi:3793_t:CDS:2, partial [Gigaspora margarita]
MDTQISDNISKAAKAAWDKLHDYYNKISESYHYASTILDPCWKLKYFQTNNLTIQNEDDNDKDFLFPVPKHFRNHNGHDELNAYFESSAELGLTKKIFYIGNMACDYLSIPATSAPTERLFSESRNIITYKRNRFKDDTIQAIMYLK